MTQPISEERAFALTQREYEEWEHSGCMSLPEAAAALQVTREAIRQKVARHHVGHRAPRWHGRNAKLHLTLSDLGAIYPKAISLTPAPDRLRTTTPWTRADRAILTGNWRTIGPGTPEFESAKRRQAADR